MFLNKPIPVNAALVAADSESITKMELKLATNKLNPDRPPRRKGTDRSYLYCAIRMEGNLYATKGSILPTLAIRYLHPREALDRRS
jgi:hypothetical protein